MRTLTTALFALLTAFASLAQAQDLPIRVGRVAHIEGRVSLYQDPESGWEKAYVNSPITSENSVWADDGSRAEVRISGMAIRVDRLTQLDVARLDEDELDAFVARGSVAMRVRHYENNERVTFNTPNARVRIRANGRYRIDVDPERLETRVTVFSGEARVGTEEGRMRIGAGRSVVIFGADPPEFFEEAARSDPFDRWTLARDERWREGRAPTYVSTYMTGYEDLDGYGRWATEPDYGTLWYPTNVASDWAPYRHGRWDYVRPWGWTWIDDAPWGYAPFHYGRWVYVRDRWAWHPGERVARPVWAPALVAWIGGSNFSVGVSSGPAVGWYPLSPWDRYEPWFQASPTYLNRVNVVVRSEPARQDRREWHRWTRERGTTVVERRVLVDSQPVRQARLTVAPEIVRQVQVAPRPEAVLPSRADVLQRRREQPQQVPAPVAQAPARAPAGTVSQAPPGRSAIVRPDFGRNAVAATPQPATQESRQTQRENRGQQREDRGQQREQQQAQERAAREAQQQQQQQQSQQQRQAQERAQREQQQAQERAAREAQQQQQQQSQQQRQAQERAQREQQQAQERAQREAQQAQERAAREGQQQQQRQAQERAQREQQQAQEKAAREAQQQAQQQQQQQRQAQERAQREAQQAQEKAAREAQQAQEKAAREAQQRAAQQQQQLQAQEKAAREALQAQERAAREAQQAAQRAAQGQGQAKGRSQKEKEEDEEKEKGKGKGKQ